MAEEPMKAIACLLLVLASCSDLPAFEPGVCGNFVLDPGETCDSDDSTCDQCSLLCGESLPGETCAGRAGYACGVDGYCHGSSGAFGEISGAPAVSATALLVTDIDQDHINDLVALSGTSLTVNYGNAPGNLETQSSTLTPFFQAAPAFGHLDGDASLDVLLPTADGVVAYSSPHGVLAPHSFSIDLSATTDADCASSVEQAFFVFAADEQYLAVLYLAGLDVRIAIIDSSGRTACPKQTAPLCKLPGPADPRTFPIDVYDTSYPNAPDGLDPRTVIQSRVLAMSIGASACTANLTRSLVAMPPFSISVQTVNGVMGAPILADLEGAGCPSLLESANPGPTLVEHRGAGQPGSCTFVVTPNPVTLAAAGVPADAFLTGHVRLDPPLAPAGAYARDALAMTSGIYAVTPARTTAREMYRADRPLALVHTGDFDDDGDLDVVAIGPGTDDLEVLYRAPIADTFLRVRVDTRGPISQFLVADFDGNGVDDIAYTERMLDGDRLLLAYGTRDRLLEPVEAGAFTRVVGLSTVQAVDSSDPRQLVDDLVIIDLAGGALPVYTLLHGSPQRTMLSYFDPREPPFGALPSSVFSGLAVGHFSGTQGATVDLLAIETESPSNTHLWTMPNGPSGPVAANGIAATGLGVCTSATATANLFCTQGARYVSWPLGDREVIVGIADGGPQRVVTLDPATFTSGIAPPRSAALDGVGKLAVRSATVADLGGPRLVVSFGPRTLPEEGAPEGSVQICRVDDRGVPAGCDDLSSLVPELAAWRCVDAAPATLVGAKQLVVVCHAAADGALYRVFYDGATLHAVPLQTGPGLDRALLRNVERVVVGDVTGDTLDDLLVVSVSFPEQHVLVVPQCSTTELACIEDARGEQP